jgi:pilus assembly protein Flp/PilA
MYYQHWNSARRSQMFLTYVILKIRLFLSSKEAASALEYAIVAAMVAVVAVLFMTNIGARVKIIFNQILVAMGGTAVA